MSLADCITKAGKALDGKDKTAIEGLVADGLSETDAVAQHLASMDLELDGVVGQIEEAGGSVKRDEPETTVYAGTFGSASSEITPYGELRSDGADNLFGGIFGSLDRNVAESFGGTIQELPIKNYISHDDFSAEVFFDSERSDVAKSHFEAILKEHKTAEDITSEEVDELLDYVMEEKSLFDDLPDMGAERYEEITRQSLSPEDVGSAVWDLQGIKGELARRMGHNAVGMPDETGESVLVLNSPKRDKPTQFGQKAIGGGPGSPAWKAAEAKGLSMSEEARMERARAMGFDTDTVYYHGTNANFDTVDLASYGEGEGGQGFGFGHHVSKSKRTADNYSAVHDQESGRESKVYSYFLPRDFNDTALDWELPLDQQGEGVTSILSDGGMMDSRQAGRDLYYEIAQTFSDEFDGDKSASEFLLSIGIQGIRYLDEMEGAYELDWLGAPDAEQQMRDKGLFNYTIFDPSNIRSVNAAFDPDQADSPVLLAQSSVPQIDKNLIVTHNLSAENILAASDLGGLAAPSVAVVRSDISDFDGFGEVSLLADPEILADPKARVFDADIYSPRQPRATYNINNKAWNELVDRRGDVRSLGLNLPDPHDLSQPSGPENLQRSNAMQYLWLQEQGKAPALKNKTVAPTIKEAAELGSTDVRDEKLQAIAKTHYQELLDKVAKRSPERAEQLKDTYFLENGKARPRALFDFESLVRTYRSDGGTDTVRLRSDISKKMRMKKNVAEYNKWVAEIFNGMVKGKTLFKGFTPSGNRKYTAYNMQNVLREMTQALQSGEASFYGAPSVRSAYANEMKTLGDVKGKRDSIVTQAEMTEIKEESSSVFEDAMDRLKPFYKFDSEGWGYTEDAGTAIIEGPRGLNETFNMTPEAQKIVDDLVGYLAGLPTSYFEAKIQRAVGFEEFNTAVIPAGMDPRAVEVLKKAGLKIRRYDAKGKGKSRKDVIAEQKALLFQKGKDTARGTISLLPTGERIIQLGKDSDPSTFLHETGHLFLELEKQLAEEFGITEDQQVLLDWLGVSSFDDITVEHHEKFAETFEVYLETGKAPSLALRDVFAAFRRWLSAVYRALDPRVRAELNPEITAVFDRLLATEEEIQEAYANPAYDQFFRSKEQAGMTDVEWAAYQKRVQRAKDKAQSTIDQKIIAQLTRLKTAEWKAEKAPLIEQEKERLSKLPVYQILSDAKEGPMNHALVAEINGGKIPGNMIGRTKTDGIDPAEYAEVYGYASADMMIKAIRTTPALNKAADEAAQALMLEKYGDILNDGSIEREAQEAIQNDEQAALLLMELRALSKKTGQMAINREYLKSQTKQMIEGMTYAEIKPGKFYRAELRAAQKAAKATNDQEAHEAKTQQIINHYLYRESLLVREAMERQRKYIRQVQGRKYNEKQVHPSYISKLKMVANMYDLRTNSERVAYAGDVINWYEGQLSSKVPDITLLDENLIKALAAKDASIDNQVPEDFALPQFDDLTSSELRGVYDQLRHLRFIGGQLSNEQAAETAKVTQEIYDSIIENGGKDKPGTRGIPSVREESGRKFDHLVNKLPSLMNMVRKLDGFKKDGQGVMFKTLYALLTEGNNRVLDLQKEFYERFKTELSDITDIGLTRNDSKEYKLSDGRPFAIHSESRFVMGLYWGTESSREAIRQGWNLTDADVKMILADLTDKQLDVMEAVWGLNEGVWPMLAEAGVARYGVAPPKLDSTPFAVRGRVMRGGHLRLFYDSTRTELKSEQNQISKTMDIVPSKAGSLHSRVGSGGLPPLLDVNNITRALDESIHFIAFAEPAAGIRRIVNNETVKGAIEKKHGVGFYKAFIESIDSVTGNRGAREVLPMLSGVLRHLRKSVSYQYIVLNVRNVLDQITAIPMAIDEVGGGAFSSAASRIVADPSLIDFIVSKSAFMDNRASLVNKTASDYFRQLSVGDLNIPVAPGKSYTMPPKVAKAYRFVEEHGYILQTQMDALLAYPTWLAKYEQVLEELTASNPNATEAEANGFVKTAVTLADTSVAESVGSGSDMHLGGLYQSTNNEWIQFFTMMGSWFNNQYQRIYRDTKGFTTFANVEAIKSIMVVPMFSALMSAAVRMDGPDEDDLEGMLKWTKWGGQQYIMFLSAMVPLLRDFTAANIDQRPVRNVYEGALGTPLRVIGEVKAYSDDRQTGLKTSADLISTAATVIPLPGSGNITRFMDYVDSYNRGLEGKTFNPYQGLVEGSDKNDRQR
tara:strand:+ start:1419 stop:8033 length:6615 start_codon:yes stop_codon:yes gene_type:complete